MIINEYNKKITILNTTNTIAFFLTILKYILGGTDLILYYPYFDYKTECKRVSITFPPQHQPVQPGLETLMCSRPYSIIQTILEVTNKKIKLP